MKRAFTLIELLVVIAIIAILAAILFPVFAQVKEAAFGVRNMSNLRQISLAVLQYNSDQEDTFPLAVCQEPPQNLAAIYPPANGKPLQTTPPGVIPWHEAVALYLKETKTFVSPLATAPSATGGVAQFHDSAYFGAIPRAAGLYVSGPYPLRVPYAAHGQNAYWDGPFGVAVSPYAVNTRFRNAPAMTQSSIEWISDIIMVADAGQYDMGFLNPVDPGTVGGPDAWTCSRMTQPNPHSQTTGYVGPWARRVVKGHYAGGKSCYFEKEQKGATSFVATDGSAKTMELERVYQTVPLESGVPILKRMNVSF